MSRGSDIAAHNGTMSYGATMLNTMVWLCIHTYSNIALTIDGFEYEWYRNIEHVWYRTSATYHMCHACDDITR